MCRAFAKDERTYELSLISISFSVSVGRRRNTKAPGRISAYLALIFGGTILVAALQDNRVHAIFCGTAKNFKPMQRLLSPLVYRTRTPPARV